MTTRSPHSRESALRSACMRLFGYRWLVFVWNAATGAWDMSHPTDYDTAQRLVKEHRCAVQTAPRMR